MTQSLSAEDDLYQGERGAVKWQSAHCCCVETLPIVIGYISYFVIYWQKTRDIGLTPGLHIPFVYLTVGAILWKLLPWSQVVYRVSEWNRLQTADLHLRLCIEEDYEVSRYCTRKLCYLFCCDNSMSWNKMSSFWHRVHNYYYHIISGRLRKFHHKINTQSIPLVLGVQYEVYI